MLDGIPFAVIGGVATRLYMPERTTADIDLLVRATDFDAAVAQLVTKGYRQLIHPLHFADTRLGLIGQRVQSALPIDVLSSDQPWVDDAVATVRRDDTGLPIVDLPYLVALKLDASRGIDQGDLTRMLGFAAEDELARVRAVVGQLLPADLEDLEQYIEIGRFEVGGEAQHARQIALVDAA